MTFTDDDLKRLKDPKCTDHGCCWCCKSMQALLARLEAAERVCDHFYLAKGATESLNDLLEVWQKAAGR